MSLELQSTHRGSAGRASGFRWLDGSFYGPLVACVMVGGGVGFLLMTISGGSLPIPLVIAVASSPTVVLMAYVILFRRNKPPGYDRDLLATLQFGREHDPSKGRLRHPHLG